MLVKPAFFESLISQVIKIVRPTRDRELIAIDGKRVCTTSELNDKPLHLLNAMAIDDGIALSQIACERFSLMDLVVFSQSPVFLFSPL